MHTIAKRLEIRIAILILNLAKQLKRFIPLNVRKTLAETLVFFEISYCNVVYAQLPNYQMHCLQRIQNTATGYVLNKYARMTNEIERWKWLPIKENNEFSISKLVFLALNDTNWPKYLPIETVKNWKQKALWKWHAEKQIALATKLWFLTSHLSLSDVLLSLIVLNIEQKNITWIKHLVGLYLCK